MGTVRTDTRREVRVSGQLRADIPKRVMVEMSYGAMYYRLLLGTDELDTREAATLLEYTLSGLRPASPATGQYQQPT